MNNSKIYTAQLDVSKFFTVETVTNLIDRLSYLGKDVYYNNKTRSIDIEIEDGKECDDIAIREELKIWLHTLEANKESIEIICNNINLVFNITKLGNINTIKVYLY